MSQFLIIASLVLKWLIVLGIIGWLMVRWLKRTEDDRLVSKWIASAVLLPLAAFVILTTNPFFGVPLGAACAIIVGVMWAPNLGSLVTGILTSAVDGGGVEIDPAPLYSITEAKRKQGKYAEAIAEVHKELARFPNDFQGWLLLAQIQADDLKDLPAARDTIERILHQEGHSPINLAHALNRLADWQLKLAQDPEAGRESLERIRTLCPDTELAQLAAQRIAHLTSREMLAEKQAPRIIALPHSDEHLGLRQDFTGMLPPDEDLETIAAKYVNHLEQYPLDNEAREKLALIYAEHFHRLDLAVEQLEQLIAYPHQPAKQVVHWLNLLADLQIKYGENLAAAREALQRAIDRFPNTAAAEIARSRMPYLPLELKGRQKNPVVKLGSYEQNLGLKKKWPT